MNKRDDGLMLVVVIGTCEDAPKAQDTAAFAATGGSSRYNSAAYRNNHERIFGQKSPSPLN